MDAIFFALLWIAIPSGGHSDIFGSQAECERVKAEVSAQSDVMYVSDCAELRMTFLRQVRHEYQPPRDFKGM